MTLDCFAGASGLVTVEFKPRMDRSEFCIIRCDSAPSIVDYHPVGLIHTGNMTWE